MTHSVSNRRALLKTLGAVSLIELSGLTSREVAASSSLLGREVQAFELELLSGGRWDLKSQAAKVILIDFWASWCAPCKQSFPFYERLLPKFEKRLTMLAVSVDDERAAASDFVKTMKTSFPVGWDRGQLLAKRFSPGAMPTLFILDEKRVVRHIHAGFRRSDEESVTKVVSGLCG